MGKSAILAVRIIGDAKGAVQAFNDAGNAASGVGGKIAAAGPLIAGIATAAVGAAVAAGKALYDIGAQFNGLENTIRVGTGASGEALNGLVDSAKNIASVIPAPLESVGTTVADLNTRLGLSGDTLETVAKQYLEAGRILGEDVDISTTSAAFSAFKIEGEAVEGAMDSLFQVSQATGVGMNDLASQVQANAPVLQELGFNFKNSAALIGSFDKAGLDSQKVMGSMGKALVGLAKPGENLQDTFKRSIGEIEAFMNAGDKAAALESASKIFGTKGAPQMLAAIREGKLAFGDLMGSVEATSDTILGLGKETMSAAERWQVLQNKALVALEPVGSAIFDGVGKALEWVLDLVNNFDLQAFLNAHPIIGELGTAFSEFGSAVMEAWATLSEYLSPAIEWLAGVGEQYLNDLLTVFKNVLSFISALLTGDWAGAWQSAKNIVQSAITLVMNYVGNLWSGIRNVFSTIGSYLYSAMSSAWNSAVNAVSSGVSRAISYVTGLPGRMVSAIRSGIGAMYGVARDLINGFINGVKNMAGAVWDSVTGVFSGAVDSVKSLLGINSPSRLFRSIGQSTGEGLLLGINDHKRTVNTAFKDLLDLPPAPRIDVELNARARHGIDTNGYKAQAPINITVNGALDPVAVATQIENLLTRHRRRTGALQVGGLA